MFSIIMDAISFTYKTTTYIAILDNWKAGGWDISVIVWTYFTAQEELLQ